MTKDPICGMTVAEVTALKTERDGQKIRDLKAMEKALSGLVTRCHGSGELKGCPLVDFVAGGSENLKRSKLS
ncbi:MAG: hypothetical protein SGI98_08030 [Verrucomicrobiota bacterium]|nr:hypothetical protein [Verrucomicrobiota bacterium]